MTYVITSPCVATCDTACVDACPVDCIIGPIPVAVVRAVPPAERAAVDAQVGVDEHAGRRELRGACLPRCPVSAIHADDDVPPEEAGAIAEAEAFFRDRAGA
jgi:ferredoxin